MRCKSARGHQTDNEPELGGKLAKFARGRTSLMRFTSRITVEVDRIDSASRLIRDTTVILPTCKMHVVIYIRGVANVF